MAKAEEKTTTTPIPRIALPSLLSEMRKLSGILNVKKGITFGRYIREVAVETEDMKGFTERTKTPEHVALEKEFSEFLQKPANKGKSESELLSEFDKWAQFSREIEQFRKLEREYLHEKVEFSWDLKFEEKDLHFPKEGVSAEQIEMLSYFM